jgi:probable F420-dependent oxidoreductase
MRPARVGVMLPLGGRPLVQHSALVRDLERWGYDDIWVGEVNDLDAVSVLAVTAAWTDTIGVGSAVLPVFTRGPAVLATTAATLASLAPGRFTLGLGASSPAVVAGWNGLDFEHPMARTRDVVRFVRRALAGERLDDDFETFSVDGFRLEHPPPLPPPILVAALRPTMLHLGRDEADGVIVNWCSTRDVERLRAESRPGELLVRLFVCPTTDADAVRAAARRQITAYLTVPAYAEFQQWVGRGQVLEEMWACWRAGDRKAAVAAVPDATVDELVVHGAPKECADHLAAFVGRGATALALTVLDGPVDPMEALAALAPELAHIRSSPTSEAYAGETTQRMH